MTTTELDNLIATANLADTTERLMLADAYRDSEEGEEGWADEIATLMSGPCRLVDGEIRRIASGLALLEAVRADQVSAELVAEEEVEALADPSGPDCHPAVTIELTIADRTIDVLGWKLVRAVEGPNDPWNGSWIGHGWSEIVSDNDGQQNGRPCVEFDRKNDTLLVIEQGDNLGEDATFDCSDLSDEEREEVASTIRETIEEVYDDWSPTTPTDEEIRFALLAIPYGRDWDEVKAEQVVGVDEDGDEVTAEAEVRYVSHQHMERTYWTFEEATDLYDSEQECRDALAELLAERLEEAVEEASERCVEEDE